MKIFNLAEELEKERQKNKELQEDVNKYVCYYRYVKMEKEELQNRIDKAIEYIKEHSTTIDYKTMKADYNLNMNDLLDILKGSGK